MLLPLHQSPSTVYTLHHRFPIHTVHFSSPLHHRSSPSSVFIYPVIVTILFTSLTFPLGLGKFMAGELTQHDAIGQLFSNVTWSTLPPPHEAFQDLPEGSDEYSIVRQWGQPNIFVTLLLFSAFRVSSTQTCVLTALTKKFNRIVENLY